MIEVSDLTVKTGRRVLLDRVHLSVPRGAVLGVSGPSGAGKTTLLRAIAGLVTPDAGEIRLGDRTVSRPGWVAPPADRFLSMVFQSLALWPHMTAQQHLDFVIRGSRFKDQAAQKTYTGRLFDQVRLTGYEQRYPAQLSGGEQQRLAIARAMAADPACLLMDEPFSQVDDLLRAELLALTLSLKQEHDMTIVYVTHNIDEARYMADRICVMKQARVVRCFDRADAADRTVILAAMERA
jgi:ABC-type sugar transport system ATPase subunit